MRYEEKSKKQLIDEIRDLKSQLGKKEALFNSYKQQNKKESSEKRIFLEGLLHSIPDLIFCKDKDGKYIGCNPAFLHFLHYPNEDIIGKTDHDIFDRELADFFREQDFKMMEQGKPRTNEEWLEFPEGSFLYETLKAPLYTPDGDMMGLIGISRDITDRKKAEEKLIKQHDKMLSIFESIDEMIYVSDPKTHELLFANSFTRQFNKGNIIGKKCHEVFQNKDSPCSFCTNDKIFGEYLGKSYIWEYQNIKNNRFYRCIDRAIEWPDGRMVRFELAIDIHESKMAENALKESEEKFSVITKSANDAIIAINNGGLVTFWNPAAEKMFGYSSDEAFNKEIRSLIIPEQYNKIYKSSFSNFRYSGEGLAVGNTVELTAKKKDGTEFPIELSLSAIILKGEWSAVGIVRDITERKRNEQEMLQANIAAENANRAKSEFLANMSHELRTPLNSVIGFSDTLLEGYFGELNEKQIQYIENISNSGKHLLNIINTILDISKIESGKMRLYKDELNISNVIDEMISLMQPPALKKNIKMEVSFGHDIDLIEADEAKVKQILYNLIGNAVKFTEDDGSIKMKTRNENGNIVISVLDTGIGISSNDQYKLFRPFSQIDSDTSRQYDGTGLGLSLVKDLVELHGGDVWVESEFGKGSDFTFTLPVNSNEKDV
ncbi:PAS domain S-box protein [Methanolobus sp. ZRKC3]|uniref:PAS domain S-box protein n=1 Tax=Methanolobus sp. ZRKC3 TaxID=3125786 RepID=UPI00324C4603